MTFVQKLLRAVAKGVFRRLKVHLRYSNTTLLSWKTFKMPLRQCRKMFLEMICYDYTLVGTLKILMNVSTRPCYSLQKNCTAALKLYKTLFYCNFWKSDIKFVSGKSFLFQKGRMANTLLVKESIKHFLETRFFKSA